VNKDAISAVAKARYPGISRDYRVTIPPRAYLPAQDANETLRLSYNTDALIPSVGIAGTLNFDLALRDPANQRQLLPAYAGNSGDGIHGNTAFHSAKAGVATAMLPATAP
jgi:hypothetical protein